MSADGKSLAYKMAPSGRYGLTVENFMTFEKGFDKPTLHAWNGPQAIQMNAPPVIDYQSLLNSLSYLPTSL